MPEERVSTVRLQTLARAYCHSATAITDHEFVPDLLHRVSGTKPE